MIDKWFKRLFRKRWEPTKEQVAARVAEANRIYQEMWKEGWKRK